MKVTLKKIEKVTSTEELADVLNYNFDQLNELQHKREMAIFNRLGELESNMNSKFQNMNSKLSEVDSKTSNLENKLDQILDHLSKRKLLTEE